MELITRKLGVQIGTLRLEFRSLSSTRAYQARIIQGGVQEEELSLKNRERKEVVRNGRKQGKSEEGVNQ